MKGLMKGGLIVGGVLAGLAAISKGLESVTVETVGIGEVTKALLELSDGADVASTSLTEFTNYSGWDQFLSGGQSIESIADAFDRVEASSKGLPKVQTAMADFLHITGATQGDLVQAREAVESIDAALTSMVQSGASVEAAEAVERLGLSAEDVEDRLPGYTDALADADNQQRLTADSASGAATEWAGFDNSIGELNDTLADTIGLHRELSGEVVAVDEAVIGFQRSLDDSTAALEENGATLDVNTEAGRRNRESLIDIRDSAFDLVESLAATDASQAELTEAMGQGREAFILTAEQMGMNRSEAEALADSYGLIPSKVATAIKLTGFDGTYASLRAIQAQIREITGTHTARIAMGAGGSGGTTAYATGGPVYGPGTATSDSFLIRASNGEYMQREAAHRFWGTQTMDAINRNDVSGVWAAMATRGFVDGGSASYTVASPSVNVTMPPSGGGGGPVQLADKSIKELGDYIIAASYNVAGGRIDSARRTEALATQLAGRMG
jgi:hypothetical protein